jgi:hypothetical protein
MPELPCASLTGCYADTGSLADAATYERLKHENLGNGNKGVGVLTAFTSTETHSVPEMPDRLTRELDFMSDLQCD